MCHSLAPPSDIDERLGLSSPPTLKGQTAVSEQIGGLSVAIIARDEEQHIEAALESATSLASEILLLLDDRTTDRTAEIGRAHGARVIVEPWRGFPAQRNRALDLCSGEWVLFLDADERVSPELCAELRALFGAHANAYQTTLVGFWIPRRNRFFGRTLQGGGWYPDYQLRLLCTSRARYDETRLVHEFASLDGAAGYLNGHLLHLNIEQLDELWHKQTSYALQEAQTLYLAGQRARWRNLIGAPLREFHRRYVRLAGYRDGAIGLFLCATLAYFELVKYIHLKGLEHAR